MAKSPVIVVSRGYGDDGNASRRSMTKKQQGSDWCVRKGQASCEFNTSRSRAQGSSVLREAQEEDGVLTDKAGGVTVALLHSRWTTNGSGTPSCSSKVAQRWQEPTIPSVALGKVG